MKATRLFVVSLLSSLIVAACGGGSSTPSATGTAQFLDSAVEGLAYASGSESGRTGADGTFTYVESTPVTFSVGGVTIGSVTLDTTGDTIIVTPVDLVAGADASNATVLNISRFLLMLDTDGDAGNGITISQAVASALQSTSNVDFASASFDADVATIVSAVGTADSRVATLPAVNDAEDHLSGTIYCAFQGGYLGTYAGDATGEFALIVDALTGEMLGVGEDNVDMVPFPIIGQLNTDGTIRFGVTSQATFTGAITRTTSGRTLSGTWANALDIDAGTYTATQFALAVPAGSVGTQYSGTFSGATASDDVGAFRIAVDPTGGNIVGVGVSAALSQSISDTFALSGTIAGGLQGGTVSFQIDSTGGTFTGTLSADGLNLQGTWTGVGSGTFSGCKAF